MYGGLLSLPISADSSKNPTSAQKTELLRAGEWKMLRNPFYSLGMANACIHLGSREKPSFSPWFCCHFQSVIYFILHDCPWVWGETISLKQGTWSRAVFRQDYPLRSDLHHLSNKKWLLDFVNACTCMQLTQYMVIPDDEEREKVWEKLCSHNFLSLVYLWRTPKSITRGEELPFQCHPSSLATAGPTPEKRNGVGSMVS